MSSIRALFGLGGLCLVVLAQAALADPPGPRRDLNVEAVLPGCRSLVATQGIAMSTEAAFCNGMFDTLLYLGELLPRDICYAVPIDIPRHQVVQAVVDDIEEVYPRVKEQHFRALALDVLLYKWPCHYADG